MAETQQKWLEWSMWDSEEGLVPCLQELTVSRVAGTDQGLRLGMGTLCSNFTQELGQAWTMWPVAEGGTPGPAAPSRIKKERVRKQ